MAVFHELLSLGLFHAEEQVMTYWQARRPELCTLYFGDYFSVASNYHGPTEDYNTIKWAYIEEAWKQQHFDQASQAARAVLGSVEKGILSLPEEEIVWLKSVSL